MSTTDEAVDAEATETQATDVVREAIAKAFADELGDGLVAQHIHVSSGAAGSDMWIRIDRDRWVAAARFAKEKLAMTWLDFVSAIDWMPSPFGREMEAEQDWVVHGRDEPDTEEQTTGVAGGDTRFQLLLRLYSPEEHIGITIKADLPDDDLRVDTLIPVFPGASWHEREMHEMFGIQIDGHPDLRALYLPTGFEGNPLRKDYPLVARRVKPWPGIVDVEAMPDEDRDDGDEAGAGAASEAGEASAE